MLKEIVKATIIAAAPVIAVHVTLLTIGYIAELGGMSADLGTVSDLLAGMDVELECTLRPLGSGDRRVVSMRRSAGSPPRAKRS